MATGDVIFTMTPMQYAEYTDLRNRLADAERDITQLTEALTEAARVIDRYRAALVGYSTWAHWQPCPALDGSEITMLCDWIGGGEGPDIAEKALASVTESEAK